MFESIEEEEKEPDGQKPTDYTGVIIFVATLPILLFFTHIGKTDLGLNVGICLSMNVLAIKNPLGFEKTLLVLGNNGSCADT